MSINVAGKPVAAILSIPFEGEDLDSASNTIESHFELHILCSSNAARATLTSLLF